ncbi:MAG: XTP/dITP diphosphatase [Thermodesulfovibrionales bacterium]
MELVAATRNRKKLEEMRRILEGAGVRLMGLDDFPSCPEVEETGATFEENAVAKARAVMAFTGKAAVADDSGLEVDALGGAPGVFSARYAGEGASDRENFEKLLREMAGVPEGRRTARFVCVIALALPGGPVETFRGAVEGTIGRGPEGRTGFGYDPVFYPLGHRRTFAQMEPAEKDSMSHRGRALEGLRRRLAGLAEGAGRGDNREKSGP